MANIVQCYDFMNEIWKDCQNVYIISDPHFSDKDMIQYFNCPSDEVKIKQINSVLSKKDCLIILGDIGDYNQIQYLKAQTKILVTGNHDVGAAKLKRHKQIIKYDSNVHTRAEAIQLAKEKYGDVFCDSEKYYDVQHQPYIYWAVTVDNKLFDYIYTGPLTIGPKLILSHEPVDCDWALNLHGHTHSKDWVDDKNHFDLCGEKRNYVPLNLKTFIKQGGLKDIESIHRKTINAATARRA